MDKRIDLKIRNIDVMEFGNEGNYDRVISIGTAAKFETRLAVNPTARKNRVTRGDRRKRSARKWKGMGRGGHFRGIVETRRKGKNGNFVRVNSERYAERVTRLVIGLLFISLFTPSFDPANEKFLPRARLKNNSRIFRFFPPLSLSLMQISQRGDKLILRFQRRFTTDKSPSRFRD